LHRYRIIIPFLFIVLLASQSALAQYKIKGTVYDSTRNYPLELVSVLTTAGKGTVTNSEGVYEIEVAEKDSIWFSYLGKPTVKFPVLKIANPFGFDISLKVNVTVLKEVKVRPRNYKQDSAQNRLDYAKIFNYKKPGLKTVTPQYGVGAGFDLNEIINAFRFKRNRSMLSFQKRLLEQEREKSVSHRFNKALVRRLTMLDGAELDSFMLVFRPSYEFTMSTGDYDFQQYIKTAHARFKRGLPPLQFLRPEEVEE
jgi:plasmid maintenance system killer protein